MSEKQCSVVSDIFGIFAINSTIRSTPFAVRFMALQPSFPHRHLISADQLSADDIHFLFSHAARYLDFLRSPSRKLDDLQGVSVVLAFFENSTRTRFSFDIAAKRLSAEVTTFQAAGSSVSKGESLLDTVRNIEAMHVDVLVMRHPSSGAPVFLRDRIGSSIINAGDGWHQHPTQGLLDAFTLYRHCPSLKGLKVCIVGDVLHSRVARSNISILRTLGAEVAVCGPGTLIPAGIEALGVRRFRRFDEALEWADVVNVLRIQMERMQQGLFPSLEEFTTYFGVTMRQLRRRPEVLVLHPGPINRGVELDAEAADSAQSLILPQVEHGVAIRMALLALIAGNRREGKS